MSRLNVRNIINNKRIGLEDWGKTTKGLGIGYYLQRHLKIKTIVQLTTLNFMLILERESIFIIYYTLDPDINVTDQALFHFHIATALANRKTDLPFSQGTVFRLWWCHTHHVCQRHSHDNRSRYRGDKTNTRLLRVAEWLKENQLEYASQKTEAALVTQTRKISRVVQGQWMDVCISCKEGHQESREYTASVWHGVISNNKLHARLVGIQRKMDIGVCSTYNIC